MNDLTWSWEGLADPAKQGPSIAEGAEKHSFHLKRLFRSVVELQVMHSLLSYCQSWGGERTMVKPLSTQHGNSAGDG